MATIFLPWNDTFITSNTLIDQQNETLITHINGYLDRLQYIVREEPKQEILIELFSSTIPLIKQGFSKEEELYTSAKNPMIEAHKTEHQNLINYLTTLLTKVQSGQSIDLNKQVKTLSGLFSSHFTIFDSRAVLAITQDSDDKA